MKLKEHYSAIANTLDVVFSHTKADYTITNCWNAWHKAFQDRTHDERHFYPASFGLPIPEAYKRLFKYEGHSTELIEPNRLYPDDCNDDHLNTVFLKYLKTKRGQ